MYKRAPTFVQQYTKQQKPMSVSPCKLKKQMNSKTHKLSKLVKLEKIMRIKRTSLPSPKESKQESDFKDAKTNNEKSM